MEIKQETMGRNEEATNSKAGYYDCIEKAHGKVCAAVNIPKNSPREYCVRMIRKIVACRKPDWTPEDLRDRLTPEIATELGLWPLIKRLPCPVELDPKQDLCYVAWELYPETRDIKEIDLVHMLFRDIVSGERQKFPKGYFFGLNGAPRAKAVFKFFMNDFAIPYFNLCCIQDAYEAFGTYRIHNLLKKCNLDRFVRDRFGSPLNFLHTCLGDDADDSAYFNTFFGPNKKRNREVFLLDCNRVRQLNSGNLPIEYIAYLQAQGNNQS